MIRGSQFSVNYENTVIHYVPKSDVKVCICDVIMMYLLSTNKTRMSANAQRDGRPAEYRWHPLFNATKFGWRPLLECHAVTLPRCETRWNLQACPKLPDRSQPLVGLRSPYCEDTWRSYCCLTSFFPIVDKCLSCEDIAWQICAMVHRWRFLAIFCVLYFQRAVCSTFQTCMLNLH